MPIATAIAFACALAATGPGAFAQSRGQSAAPDPRAIAAATQETSLRHYLQGIMLENEGDLAGAIEEVGRAFAFDPSAPDLAVKLADLSLQAGNPSATLDYARRATTLGDTTGVRVCSPAMRSPRWGSSRNRSTSSSAPRAKIRRRPPRGWAWAVRARRPATSRARSKRCGARGRSRPTTSRPRGASPDRRRAWATTARPTRFSTRGRRSRPPCPASRPPAAGMANGLRPTPVAGAVAALIALAMASKQIQGLVWQLQQGNFASLMMLEVEMNARKQRVDEAARDLQKLVHEQRSQEELEIFREYLKHCIENWLNLVDRFAFCIRKQMLDEEDFKQEYRRYIEELVQALPQYFTSESAYDNVIQLCERWKINRPNSE